MTPIADGLRTWWRHGQLAAMLNGNGVRTVMLAPAVALAMAGCGDNSTDDAAATSDDSGSAGQAEVDGSGIAESAPTIDELLALDRPLNIAHAGGDHEWPHSTLYAYGESVEAGVDMLELDIRLSADGVAMVHHDETVDRLTDAEGPLTDFTEEELQEFDAAYWFEAEPEDNEDDEDASYPYRGVRTGDVDPPEGYTADDFIIPTLRDVAERFPQMPLDIEIKGEGDVGAAAAEALAAELEDLDREDSVVVVSFDQATVDRFAELAPEVEISPGTDDLLDWYSGDGDLSRYRILQLPTVYGDVEVLTPENIAAFEAEDQPLHAWVFMAGDDEETAGNYQHHLDLGVDGIITARPSEFPG